MFLPAGRYYVSVDSGHDLFTGRSLAGPYTLRSWVNDVKPPRVELITTWSPPGARRSSRACGMQPGVDPLSLLLLFGLPASARLSYDPQTGIAVFPIPGRQIRSGPGSEFMRVVASDFQETKNIDTGGTNPMPNTRIHGIRMRS